MNKGLSILLWLLLTGCMTPSGSSSSTTGCTSDLYCEDHDPCTANVCEEDGSCTFTPTPGAPCTNDMFDACWTNEVCNEDGTCGGGEATPAGTECNDADPCTLDDLCDGNGFCQPGELVAEIDEPCRTCVCSPDWGMDCTPIFGPPECACMLYGKIQYVDSFPDVKVKVVTSFEDIAVKEVTSFPDKPGEWEIVNSFPDIKVQIVDSFEDYTIKYVDSFPGCD